MTSDTTSPMHQRTAAANRAMSAVCAVVLLCLVSLSHSAPLDCATLLQPLGQVDPQSLEGRWAMVAGSLSLPPLMERLRRRDSAALTFSSDTSGSYMVFSRHARVGDKCYSSFNNITLEGSSFSHDNGSVNTTFIRTSCRDCILLSCDVESGKRLHLYLFSRRRQLEQKEVEEFRAQVECLNMPPPVMMEPAKELCPVETDGPATRAEEKTEGPKSSQTVSDSQT